MPRRVADGLRAEDAPHLRAMRIEVENLRAWLLGELDHPRSDGAYETQPSQEPIREREGCANSVSCGEVVFVDEAAESDAPLYGGGWRAHGTDPLLGRLGWCEI